MDRIETAYGLGNPAKASSLDDPAPTVMAHGIGGVREYQAWIVRDHEPIPGHGGGNVRSVDDPSPIVMAAGMFGVARHQVRVVVTDMPATARTVVDKPPYRVPAMVEVAALRGSSGLRAVSTFSGCGGSCLGLEMAGFEVLWASEFVAAARDTYRLNHPGVHVDERDIRTVRAEEVLEAIGLAAGELDLLEGSPPCSSFSTAGARSRKWGQASKYSDTEQRTDDLFFEFARLVEGIQPRAFVAENVSGLVKGVAKGYFKEIHARLAACGYLVEARMLDAQWLGVPQQRQRLIFQGVRADLVEAGARPSWPSPLPYRYSVRDALPWLGTMTSQPHGWFGGGERSSSAPAPTVATTPDSAGYAGHLVEVRVVHDTLGQPQYSAGDVTDTPTPTVLTRPGVFTVEGGIPITHDPETGYRLMLEGTAIGPEYDKLAEGEQSDRYFNLVRADREAPSPCVTQAAGGRGTAGVVHPVERRKFTLLELRRICGFPDDFQLTGSYQQRWERLGRAVPPPMMRAIAEAVRDGVLSAP